MHLKCFGQGLIFHRDEHRQGDDERDCQSSAPMFGFPLPFNADEMNKRQNFAKRLRHCVLTRVIANANHKLKGGRAAWVPERVLEKDEG
jgi:hypothetical protein